MTITLKVPRHYLVDLSTLLANQNVEVVLRVEATSGEIAIAVNADRSPNVAEPLNPQDVDWR
jgi:hypothetical protein